MSRGSKISLVTFVVGLGIFGGGNFYASKQSENNTEFIRNNPEYQRLSVLNSSVYELSNIVKSADYPEEFREMADNVLKNYESEKVKLTRSEEFLKASYQSERMVSKSGKGEVGMIAGTLMMISGFLGHAYFHAKSVRNRIEIPIQV